MKVKVKDVQIPQERQRGEFGDLLELAESIKELGQLVPILVEKGTMELVAGERRLQAHKLLGLDEIEVVFKEDLTPMLKRKMELTENIQRKDLTWEERVRAVAEIVAMAQTEDAPSKSGPKGAFQSEEGRGKSYEEVAKSLGISKAALAQDVEMAAALKAFPQLADEPNKATAFKRYKRALATAITKELLSRGEVKEQKELSLGNAEELIKRVGDGTVNLVLFDPPFGIDLQNTGSAGKTGSGEGTYEFDDTLLHSRNLCLDLFPQFFRVMKEPAAAFIFFPVQHYQWFYEELEEVFGKRNVASVPLIWDKGRGGTIWSGYGFSGSYEAFFFVRKGKISLLTDKCDIFHYPRVSSTDMMHIAEKPVELYKDLIESTTSAGDTVLDPTFGSGSSMEAALTCHRKAIGFEMSEAVYARACQRLEGLKLDALMGNVEEDVEEGEEDV